MVYWRSNVGLKINGTMFNKVGLQSEVAFLVPLLPKGARLVSFVQPKAGSPHSCVIMPTDDDFQDLDWFGPDVNENQVISRNYTSIHFNRPSTFVVQQWDSSDPFISLMIEPQSQMPVFLASRLLAPFRSIQHHQPFISELNWKTASNLAIDPSTFAIPPAWRCS